SSCAIKFGLDKPSSEAPLFSSPKSHFVFFKQKTAYEMRTCLEFRRVLFRSPPDAPLRERIIWSHHDTPLAGHPGPERTRELIERNYWWQEIRQDTLKYAHACDWCQRNKVDRTKRANPLHPHRIPAGPWEEISWDIIGPIR